MAVAGTVPYIVETIPGNTKPRIVTWLTWTLLTGVAGAASLSAGQFGAAVFALLGTVATSAVVVAGLRFGDRSFTTLDLFCLAGGLLGLLLWLSLDNPIFAIWAAILIDFVGLVPTLVHAWTQPAAETASAFVCVWHRGPNHLGRDRERRFGLGRGARLSALRRCLHGHRRRHHRDPPHHDES
jgi:hypothetical protein